MLAKCASLKEFCHLWEANGPGVRQWEERTEITEGWQE
jgi:hypothetical protein